jgi:hypothetical protein
MWGPCLTEVTPITEDCATATDDDCSGVANDHCGLWSKRFGGLLDQKPYGLAVSPGGETVITGQLFGAPNFGSGAITTAGGGDLFVTKLSSSGAHVWTVAFGDAAAQIGNGVALDAAGNVYVTGAFEGTMNLGAIALVSAGLSDMFVAKLDPTGAPVWALRFGDATSDQAGNAIAVGPNGHVYVAGAFAGTVDFGMGPKTAAGTTSNGVILDIDATGAVAQSLTFGGGGNDSADAIAVDSAGNVIVGGVFAVSAVFGGTTLTTKGGSDGFVVKLSPTGMTVWAKGLGSTADDRVTGVAVDSAGNVAVTGLFAGALDAGCGALTNQGATDILLAKLSSAGACTWSHGYGDPVGGQKSPSVAVDSAGAVILTDEYVGTMNFGGYPIITPFSAGPPHDVLLVKLNAMGNHVFSRRFGDSGDQDGRAVGVDAMNNIYVLGEMAGSIDFGNGALSSAGGDDIVIAKFGP